MKTNIEKRGDNAVTSLIDEAGIVRFEKWESPGYLTIIYSYDEKGSMISCGYSKPVNAI